MSSHCPEPALRRVARSSYAWPWSVYYLTSLSITLLSATSVTITWPGVTSSALVTSLPVLLFVVILYPRPNTDLGSSPLNLLSNAVYYTPEDGRIELVWYEKYTTLVMEVANSGDAIPPEDEKRVFEPFFQSTARRTGPIKGSGIGLSVARECMEAQGGSLSLVSHKELPVCFRLVCPAY